MIRLVVLALAACGAAAPACPLPPKSAVVQPFLWKAQKGDGPIVWLYGTIHNAGGDDVPAAAWTALEASPKVVTELGGAEPDPEKVAELIQLPPGKGLDQQLPASDWYDLRDALRGTIKEAVLARVRPWFAVVQLNRKLSPGPSPTMDEAITRRAKTKGKPVDALESLDVQLKALADTVTIADLQQEIGNRHQLACANNTLRAVYNAGDLATLEPRLLLPQTRSLIVDRSKAWIPKIESLFAAGGFVAVGLGHFVGDEGLPALLTRAGYTVVRVP